MTCPQVARLYREYGPIIFSQCRRILRDATAAEDATQEVFCRVLTHIASAPPEHAMLRWLRRISINYCLNLKRDGDRRPESCAELPDIAVDDFERGVLSRNIARKLMNEVPKLASAAVLHHVQGMTQSQVAQTLGISRRTVLYRLEGLQEYARKVVEA
jgi:RNA polymerase sigma-70 factor (ECF subfamily)